METINTYSEGMDKDSSPLKYSPKAYYEANNIHVITEDGLSSGAVVNEKGNRLFFKIPQVQKVYKINFVTQQSNSFITINGVSQPMINASNIEELYSILISNQQIAQAISIGSYRIDLIDSSVYVFGLDAPLSISIQGSHLLTLMSDVQTPKIVGWGSFNDYIVVFTSEDSSSAPSCFSQIWLLQYFPIENTIVDIDSNGYLIPSFHLKYNNKLNLSTYHQVKEVKCRYENSKTARVVWTDNYNTLRSVNIFSPELFTVNPDTLGLANDISLTCPIVRSIGVGSIPTGSTVAYSYRLFKKEGGVSIFAPLSQLTTLSETDPYGPDFQEQEGSPKGSTANKSVTYEIEDVDNRYDVIEHFAIIYEEKNLPQIYKFREDPVPVGGILSVTHSGNEDYIEMSEQEFNSLQSLIKTVKTMDVKDNRLVLGNITTEKFDIDFDARAYRFSSSPNTKSTLYDYTGTAVYEIYGGQNPQYPTNQELDAINAFNAYGSTVQGSEVLNPNKYQADGITIGGQGPNIKYKFITNELLGDVKNTYQVSPYPPFVDVWKWGPGFPISTDGGQTTRNFEGTFKSFKSPLIQHTWRGYSRGETYRFGVVFYNKKGNPSYVKWIGDIKFPEVEDGFKVGDYKENTNYLYTLGIEFTIDISSIQNDISGFRFVRCERTENDKTVLGTGILTWFDPSNSTIKGSLFNKYAITYEASQNLPIAHYGDNTLRDFPSVRNYLDNNVSPQTGRYCALLGPLGLFTRNEFKFKKGGDYLKITGFYNTHLRAVPTNSVCHCFYKTTKHSLLSSAYGAGPNWKEEYDILDAQLMVRNGCGKGTFEGFKNTGIWIKHNHNNSTLNRPLGVGGRKYFLYLEEDAQYQKFIDDGYSANLSGTKQDNFENRFPTQHDQYFKEVSYRRKLVQQYGGNTFNSRAAQAYIPCSDFIKISEDFSSPRTIQVFQGDVFTNQFDQNYIYPNETEYYDACYPSKGGLPNVDVNGTVLWKQGVAISFPVETTINTEWRTGKHIARSLDPPNQYLTDDDYLYNHIYSQENTLEQKFFTKAIGEKDLVEFPVRLWASEEKIDGESIDSWKDFKPFNIRDVDGAFGEINKVLTYKDIFLYFQDQAFGIAAINDKTIVPSESGIELVLGRGDILADHRYLSTTSGCKHQLAVVPTETGVYYFDINSKQLKKYTPEGDVPLSDIEGMASFFRNNFKGFINNTDNLLGSKIGIHGIYDKNRNRVLFTFMDEDFINTGEELIMNNNVYTVGYSEFLKTFESFYSFKPYMYLGFKGNVISTDPENLENAYIHGVGNRGEFYGNIYDSDITLIVNPKPTIAKIFNNINYYSTVHDSSGNEIVGDTISTIQVYNNYQDTGEVILVPNVNIKRRMRTWSLYVPRNISTADMDRIRDFFVFMKFKFVNNDNKKIVLHDVITNFLIGN